MEGDILAISDEGGEIYVDNSFDYWNRHGFKLINTSFENAIKGNDFDKYFMIAFIVNQANSEKFCYYGKLIRALTNVPIVLFPYEHLSRKQEMTYLIEGADRVINIPADIEWIIANCIAIIRRYTELDGNKQQPPSTLHIDDKMVLNLDRYTVHIQDHQVELTKKEFAILNCLMNHRRQIMTYEQIFTEVWGHEYVDNPKHILWNHIKNIRKKIKFDPDLPQYIVTKKGVGYSYSP